MAVKATLKMAGMYVNLRYRELSPPEGRSFEPRRRERAPAVRAPRRRRDPARARGSIPCGAAATSRALAVRPLAAPPRPPSAPKPDASAPSKPVALSAYHSPFFARARRLKQPLATTAPSASESKNRAGTMNPWPKGATERLNCHASRLCACKPKTASRSTPSQAQVVMAHAAAGAAAIPKKRAAPSPPPPWSAVMVFAAASAYLRWDRVRTGADRTRRASDSFCGDGLPASSSTEFPRRSARRRRDPSPRNLHVLSAAPLRSASAESPRRSARRPREPSPRNIHVASCGVAATRLRGMPAS